MITIASAIYHGSRKDLKQLGQYKLSIKQDEFKKPIVVDCLNFATSPLHYENIHDLFEDWHNIEFIRKSSPENLQSINIIS